MGREDLIPHRIEALNVGDFNHPRSALFVICQPNRAWIEVVVHAKHVKTVFFHGCRQIPGNGPARPKAQHSIEQRRTAVSHK